MVLFRPLDLPEVPLANLCPALELLRDNYIARYKYLAINYSDLHLDHPPDTMSLQHLSGLPGRLLRDYSLFEFVELGGREPGQAEDYTSQIQAHGRLSRLIWRVDWLPLGLLLSFHGHSTPLLTDYYRIEIIAGGALEPPARPAEAVSGLQADVETWSTAGRAEMV